MMAFQVKKLLKLKVHLFFLQACAALDLLLDVKLLDTQKDSPGKYIFKWKFETFPTNFILF